MRHDHDVGQIEQWIAGGRGFVGHNIEAGRAQVSGFESVDKGGFVDQTAAGGVDQNRARFHRSDGVIVDHFRGHIGQRQVKRDDVRLSQ